MSKDKNPVRTARVKIFHRHLPEKRNGFPPARRPSVPQPPRATARPRRLDPVRLRLQRLPAPRRTDPPAWSEVLNQFPAPRRSHPATWSETVKGRAAFEQETLTRVIEARARATSVQVTLNARRPAGAGALPAGQGQLATRCQSLLAVELPRPQGRNQGPARTARGAPRTASPCAQPLHRRRPAITLARSFPSNLTAMVISATRPKPGFTVADEADLGAALGSTSVAGADAERWRSDSGARCPDASPHCSRPDWRLPSRCRPAPRQSCARDRPHRHRWSAARRCACARGKLAAFEAAVAAAEIAGHARAQHHALR